MHTYQLGCKNDRLQITEYLLIQGYREYFCKTQKYCWVCNGQPLARKLAGMCRALSDTIDSLYFAVQYNTILHTAWTHRRQNFGRFPSHERQPYLALTGELWLPSMSYWGKSDGELSGMHCIRVWMPSTMMGSSWSRFVTQNQIPLSCISQWFWLFSNNYFVTQAILKHYRFKRYTGVDDTEIFFALVICGNRMFMMGPSYPTSLFQRYGNNRSGKCNSFVDLVLVYKRVI